MKRINLLSGQASMLTQCYFKSSTRALNVYLYESDINIFYPSQFNFSTFHFLLREKENSENSSKNRTTGKKREIKTSVVNASQSKEKKGKTLQKSKSLVIKSEIHINDLDIKVKQIEKFVNKGITVTVKVENSKNIEGGFEKIFSHLQKAVTENQVPGKVTKVGQSVTIFPITTKGQPDEKLKEEKVSNSQELKSENEGKL